MTKKKTFAPMVLAVSCLLAMASCNLLPSGPADSSATSGSDEETPIGSTDTGDNTGESSEEPQGPNIYNASMQAGMFSSNGGSKTYANLTGVEGGGNGAFSYAGESIEKKTEILGVLEKYAVDNAITGIPLYENGGFVMYNPRVVKATNNYVTGYGFGITREGYLNGDSATELNSKKSYYQTWDSSDPGTVNYLNSDNSQVSTFNSACQAGYFDVKLNSRADGYNWFGSLSSKNRPVLVDANGDAQPSAASTATSATWRVYLRTGADGGVAFRTNSSKYASYDNKAVTLEDYLNAFRIMFCGKYAFYRGNEAANMSGYSYLVGSKDYWNATKAYAFDSNEAKEAFDELFTGVKGGTDEEGDYIDFTLGTATTRFYAMYTLASTLYAPINADFWNAVTDNSAHPTWYGSFNDTKTSSPVDNILSVGPYFLESWESEKGIAYKRNDNWWEIEDDDEIFRIPGIYYNILTGATQDENYIFNQFLAGNLDASSIPQQYIEDYKNDPRTTKTTGDSVFKLNLNTCTQDQWNKLFGTNGTVDQSEDNDYLCKPWMSNKDFVKGLFLSIDRDTYAAKRGSISSINYFSSNYMSDPEGGIAYNTTAAHEAALQDFWGSAVSTGGYNKNAAQASFDKAVDALIADHSVKDGDVLDMEVWWQAESQIKSAGEEVAAYFMDAFNNCEQAKAHNLTLKVDQYAPAVWSDTYYKHLMIGRFDIGFGSVSGNSLDPLNFMEVLKSDNSSGFTLNWGPDTSALDVEYDGKLWSFDTLWTAADHGVITYKGQELPLFVFDEKEYASTAEGGFSVTYTFSNAMAELMKRIDEGDEDAEEVYGSLAQLAMAGKFGVAPFLFEIGDDITYIDFATPYGAMVYECEVGDILDCGNGLDTLDWEAADHVTCDVTMDDEEDYYTGGEVTFTLSQEAVTLMADEAGYVDFYLVAQVNMFGDVATGYVAYEYVYGTL